MDNRQRWPWDGSELAGMPEMEPTGIRITKGVTKDQMSVRLNAYTEKVLVKPIPTPNTQAMMDELKPAFGVHKMGTMRVKDEQTILLRYHGKCDTLADVGKSVWPQYARAMQPVLRYAIVCNRSDPSVGNILLAPSRSDNESSRLIPIDELYGLTDKPEKVKLLSRDFRAYIQRESFRQELERAAQEIDREQIAVTLARFGRSGELAWVEDRIDRLPEIWDQRIGFAD